MARRGATPVLYELLGSASAPSGAPSGSAGAPIETGASTARQSVRVPIGWFWLSAIAALVLVAVAYQFGRSVGERTGFARGQEYNSDRALQARVASDTPDPGRANLASGRPGGAMGPGAIPGDSKGSSTSGNSNAKVAATNASTADPRERGRNYLVIARPVSADAQKLVDFLREAQLEAAAVPDDNPKFRKVVALPGFPAGTARNSEQVRKLESKVKSLGQQ